MPSPSEAEPIAIGRTLISPAARDAAEAAGWNLDNLLRRHARLDGGAVSMTRQIQNRIAAATGCGTVVSEFGAACARRIVIETKPNGGGRTCVRVAAECKER